MLKIVGLLLVPVGVILIVLGTTYEHWLRQTTPTLIKQYSYPVYRIEVLGSKGQYTEFNPRESKELIRALKNGLSGFSMGTSIEKIRLVLADEQNCCREDAFGLFNQEINSVLRMHFNEDIPKASTYEISSSGELIPVTKPNATARL